MNPQNPFELWPAIDLLGGEPVRLTQGDYTAITRYETTLKATVEAFNQCATGIHVVDLDGAKAGKRINHDALQEILRYATVPVEFGGGIRSLDDAQEIISSGVSRVIFGSTAVKNPSIVSQALKQFGPEKIVLGVDARDGFVSTEGWQEHSSLSASELIQTFVPDGLKTVIFTDIATDGMLQGPNTHGIQALQNEFPMLSIIASGGVAHINDIRDLQTTGCAGVVFGKAYYENRLTIDELSSL